MTLSPEGGGDDNHDPLTRSAIAPLVIRTEHRGGVGQKKGPDSTKVLARGRCLAGSGFGLVNEKFRH